MEADTNPQIDTNSSGIVLLKIICKMLESFPAGIKSNENLIKSNIFCFLIFFLYYFVNGAYDYCFFISNSGSNVQFDGN